MNLLFYGLARVLVAVLVFVGILTLEFVVIEVLPGDPTRLFGMGFDPTPTIIAHWGLDKPLADRYLIFISNAFRGDFGVSATYRAGIPVSDLLFSPGLSTAALVTAVMVIAVLLALILGAFLSPRRGGFLDSGVVCLLVLAFSAPFLVLTFAFVWLFAIYLPVLPSHRTVYGAIDFVGQVSTAVIPMGVLVVGSLALPTLYVRGAAASRDLDRGSSSPEPSGIRSRVFAWLRGLYRAGGHGFGAAGLAVGWVVSGSVVVEVVYNRPGLGRIFWDALIRPDVPILLAISTTLMAGVIVTVAVLDILRALFESRSWGDVRMSAPSGTAGVPKPRAVLSRFMWRPTAWVGIGMVAALVTIALGAPLFVGPYPTSLDVSMPFEPPSDEHRLGTDGRGFDVLALLFYGGSGTLLTGLTAFVVAFAILALAAAAWVYGVRWLDRLMLLATEGVLGVAWVFLLVPFPLLWAFAGYGGAGGLWLVIATISCVSWPIPARFLRLELESLGFGVSARSQGVPGSLGMTDMTRPRLLSVLPLVAGNASFAAAIGMLMNATLEFFGFPSGSTASWGGMIESAWLNLAEFRGLWWTYVPPAICIIGAVLGASMAGFALKVAFARQARLVRPVA